MATATFGAGCFWGVEATFAGLPGVTGTAVGYMGGHLEKPTYEAVCTDATGHAEVVQVEYDPGRISYEELLQAFFQLHDPTTLNRQGPDVGSQYRSVIFCHTPDQQRLADGFVVQLKGSRRWPRPVVTQVVPAGPFWRAEEYHQRYLEKRGQTTCRL